MNCSKRATPEHVSQRASSSLRRQGPGARGPHQGVAAAGGGAQGRAARHPGAAEAELAGGERRRAGPTPGTAVGVGGSGVSATRTVQDLLLRTIVREEPRLELSIIGREKTCEHKTDDEVQTCSEQKCTAATPEDRTAAHCFTRRVCGGARRKAVAVLEEEKKPGEDENFTVVQTVQQARRRTRSVWRQGSRVPPLGFG